MGLRIQIEPEALRSCYNRYTTIFTRGRSSFLFLPLTFEEKVVKGYRFYPRQNDWHPYTIAYSNILNFQCSN